MTTPPATLTGELGPGRVTMTAGPAATAARDPRARRVTGLVLPYGQPGYTSAGRLYARAGSVRLPEDLGRVKLLVDHTDNPRGFVPVGYAVEAHDTREGLVMSFDIGHGPDGDQALDGVEDRVRDAFSVELTDCQSDGHTITDSILQAVALVPIPAFAEARVASITTTSPQEDTMTDQTDHTTSPVDLTAAEVEQTSSEDGGQSPLAAQSARLKGAAGTVNSVADQLAGYGSSSAEDRGPRREDSEDGARAAEHRETLAAARMPSTLTAASSRREQKPLTLQGAIETIRAQRAHDVDGTMTAALTDITRSANPNISAPAWLGELWDGAQYQREIVPLMTNSQLSRMKGVGYRWTRKPQVKDYAGDKTEIPSSPVATEAVEVTAKRLATGNDIDRAYWDFNETEFIQAYFRACAESYAMVSDERASVAAVTAAADNVVSAEPDLLQAAARARQTIKRATRTEPSAFLVHPDDMFGLMRITTMDNPQYLSLLGVDPSRFVASELAVKGALISWAKPALTFFELPGSPLRVVAEDIARGGRDAAIFGYYATMVNNPDGLVMVPFGENPTSSRPGEDSASSGSTSTGGGQ